MGAPLINNTTVHRGRLMSKDINCSSATENTAKLQVGSNEILSPSSILVEMDKGRREDSEVNNTLINSTSTATFDLVP